MQCHQNHSTRNSFNFFENQLILGRPHGDASIASVAQQQPGSFTRRFIQCNITLNRNLTLLTALVGE